MQGSSRTEIHIYEENDEDEYLYRYLEITRYRGDSEKIGGPAGAFEARHTGCCLFHLRGI